VKAIVRSSSSPTGLTFTEVPEPVPEDDEILVEMTAASVNYGTVAYLDGAVEGSIRGSDGAGVVIAAAADGSGPAVGDRVAFATPHGSWAERTRVPAAYAATIPDGIDDVTAAAVPGAGLTALQAIRRLGSVLGRRVLVTGAAGGVGTFALQLLAQAGAIPVAWVGSPERANGLAELGAHDVITSADDLSPLRFDAIIDTVGGTTLGAALAGLTDHGTALNIGHASGSPTLIDFEAVRRLGPGRSIEAFVCTDVSATALSELLQMVRADELKVTVSHRVAWEDYDQAVEALLSRTVRGKAVLQIDH